MERSTYRLRLKIGEAEIEVEGDQEFIDKKLAYFESEILEKLGPRLAEKPGGEVEKEGKEPSLPEFYERKQPKTHPEKAAFFAFYHIILEGADEVSIEQIKKDYTTLGLSKPTRVARQIYEAIHTQRWLRGGSKKGQYRLTDTGEKMVRKLPER